MAYIVWGDVTNIIELAGDVIGAGDQAALIVEAQELADIYLAPLMVVPVEPDTDGGYSPFVVRFTALLACDIIAERRYHGDEDTFQADYDGNLFTGTKWGHKAMGMLQARRQAKAAVEKDVTEAEASGPRVDATSFISTNGRVEARYTVGFFEDSSRGTFDFTITSDGGTVAGDDLTVSCVRDNDETVWTDQAVIDSGWVSVQRGLQVRFLDCDNAPAWAQDETFTVYCEPPEGVLSEGVTSEEWNLG